MQAALVPGLEALGPADRARAEGLLARAFLAQGKVTEAASHFAEALARDRAAGLASDSNQDAMALAFVDVQRTHRFSEARRVLDQARPTAARYPDDRAQLPYYDGLLAFELGDLRGALESFRAAEAGAKRLGLVYAERIAAEYSAMALQSLGRRDEAEAILRRLREDAAPPEVPGCDAVDVLNNLGWLRLQGWHSNAAAAARAATWFREALRPFPASCQDPFRRANVLTNLAIVSTQEGDLADAKHSLNLAREAMPEPNDALAAWWLELDGEMALQENDPRRALDALARLAQDPEEMEAPDTRWRALLGRGMALERLGELDEADGAYAEAERLLDRADAEVPLGEGRGTFLRDHVDSASLRIDLALRRRRWATAASTARRSAARLLESVTRPSRAARLDPEQRARLERELGDYRRARDDLSRAMRKDDELPADERDRARQEHVETARFLRSSLERALSGLGALPVDDERPVARTEPTLILHPAADGWYVLWSDGARSWGEHLRGERSRSAEKAIAGVLGGPLRDALAHAGRFSVVAYGDLAAIDVHALSAQGGPLIERSVVTYALDVQAGRAEVTRRAAVVGDPMQDLPGARAEARETARTLALWGWNAKSFVGGEATHVAVTRAIASVDLLHYAGHAAHSGLDGWESRLGLAGGDELTVGDILALPHAPTVVVLLGCDAGRATDADASQTLAVAHAFVTAGTGIAIGPTRAVADAEAVRFSRLLYAAVASSNNWAAALRTAVLAMRAEDPASDWAAYRAFVP